MDYKECINKRNDHIEKAVDNLIDSWDLNTLMNFAFEVRLEYFLEIASEEEINQLLKDFG